MQQSLVSASPDLSVPLHEADHIMGNSAAPIRLVEYGDFECPFCARANKIVQALQEEFGTELCYAFRNYPLEHLHPLALQAALAAEAAGQQGKYWEMHNLIYRNQHALDDASLLRYAESLDLDLEAFQRVMMDEAIIETVERDIESGNHSGVSSTPGFFINERRYHGNTDLDQLRSAIHAARAS